MNRIKVLNVLCHGEKVGKMALYKERYAAFEYDKQWLANGFSISPFSLPLEQKVFIPKIDPFDGMFGVFADSLPDGWGRLLVDRLMLKNGLDPRQMGNMERLAIVGSSGMGALTYEPEYETMLEKPELDLDKIAEECAKILKSKESQSLDELFRLGGSSGGARPKILTKVDGEDWIIKFPSSEDKKDIGKQEYLYSLCAKECGIEMEETRLFPSKYCDGYFGTKRFDRKQGRIHMLSVSAILETSHRIPNLDYDLLMKLTLELTKDYKEIEKMYRLMCFNVYAHNRDDHSKNFTFLYDENRGHWKLSPAYDLTYSYSLGGEHATTVHGNGKEPKKKDLLAVANAIGLPETEAKRIADDIQECVYDKLGEYLRMN